MPFTDPIPNVPVVVFDLDGVLLDFESAWTRCASMVLDRPIFPVCPVYPLGIRYSLSRDQVSRIWDRFHDEAW